MLDSPPYNLDTTCHVRLAYHGEELYDLSQSHRVYLSRWKSFLLFEQWLVSETHRHRMILHLMFFENGIAS